MDYPHRKFSPFFFQIKTSQEMKSSREVSSGRWVGLVQQQPIGHTKTGLGPWTATLTRGSRPCNHTIFLLRPLNIVFLWSNSNGMRRIPAHGPRLHGGARWSPLPRPPSVLYRPSPSSYHCRAHQPRTAGVAMAMAADEAWATASVPCTASHYCES